MRAENFPHHAQQLQGTAVTYSIVDAVGIFTGVEDAFITQDCQMLGNVALRGANLFNYVMHANFVVPQSTKYLQAQRV